MKKRNMTQRLLACLLCIVLTVLTCACASVDAPKGENTDAETSALDVLESEAESSSEAGEHISADDDATLSEDVTITPIEPIIPEERETTLEKVFSFDIGMEGLFQYSFIFYDDPSSSMPGLSGKIYTDGKGTFYQTYASEVMCLNDGIWFPLPKQSDISDIIDAEFVGNDMYLLRLDGTGEHYDISAGFDAPVLKGKYSLFDARAGEWGELQTFGEDTLYFVSDDNEIFTFSKEPVSAQDSTFLPQNGAQSVTVDNGVFVIPSGDNQYALSRVTETQLWTTMYYLSGDHECVMYDRNGNLTSRVLFDAETFDHTPCEVEFEHAGKTYTTKEYVSTNMTVDDAVFEGLVKNTVFFDAYGNMYFSAYYLDHCEIYRVNAGYTSANFREETIAPIVPEERETTLEKVFSFDIGMDEMIQYDFTFYNNPSNAMMAIPGVICTDGKGTFYLQRATDLMRLSDGMWLRTGAWKNITDVEFVGDDLYLLFTDYVVKQYDISAGFEAPVLEKEYQLSVTFEEKTWVELFVIGNSEPIVVTGDHQLLTLSNETISGNDAPFVYQADSDSLQSVQAENGTFVISTAHEGDLLVSAFHETDIWLKTAPTGNRVYSKFDQNGNISARVLYEVQHSDEAVRIDWEFEHAGKTYTKDSYYPHHVAVGTMTFDELFEDYVFFDSNGNMYFVAYYLDHCEIYRVNPGYTSADLTKK